MEINTDKYSINYIKGKRIIKMSGTLRLQDKDEYREIFDLLTKAANETTGLPLIVDMKDLIFLSSEKPGFLIFIEQNTINSLD